MVKGIMIQKIDEKPAWVTATSYLKNNFVYEDGFYYFCTQDHISTEAFEYEKSIGLWDGTKIAPNGKQIPYFIWTPSYNIKINENPRVKATKYGEGYENRQQDGIHNLLLELDLNFENIDIYEFTSIINFLRYCKGVKVFCFIPPAPYNVQKNFVCRTWDNDYLSFNNFRVNCKFEEVPI